MKTITIRGIMADFLDSIRAYEHESGEAIYFDERESSEFVDIYFNGGGEINIEESNADEYTWKNKRLFSYNDIEKFQSGGEGVFYDVKAIAKERVCNG